MQMQGQLLYSPANEQQVVLLLKPSDQGLEFQSLE